MAEVRLSEGARADLADIDAYGAEQFGEDAADGYQRGISDTLDRLSRFPRLGEARPAYGMNIRCIVYRRHRILYRLIGEEVVVARILHHSRDVARHLGT